MDHALLQFGVECDGRTLCGIAAGRRTSRSDDAPRRASEQQPRAIELTNTIYNAHMKYLYREIISLVKPLRLSIAAGARPRYFICDLRLVYANLLLDHTRVSG
jgi:hypothetical protein